MALDFVLRFREEGAALAERDVDKMRRGIDRAGSSANRLGRVMRSNVGGAVSGMRSLITAVGGVGAVMGARAILNYEQELARLRIDAKLTAEEFGALEQQISDASQLGITNTEALAALKTFQDFGGILREGKDLLGDIAKLSRATGTPMEDTTMLAATLVKNLGMSKDEAREALATLKKIGDEGNISLRTSASVLPRLFATGKLAGFGGKRSVGQLYGAFQAIAGQIGAGPEAAARGSTQLEALISGLVKAEGKLRQAGVRVFAHGAMRDLDIVIGEVLKKTGGDVRKLHKFFPEVESLRAIAAFADTAKPGHLAASAASLLRIKASASDLDTMFRDFSRFAGTAQKADVALAQLQGEATKFGLQIGAFIADNPLSVGAGLAGRQLAGAFGPLASSVFTATYALGMFADQAWGLSDKLSDAMIWVDKIFGYRREKSPFATATTQQGVLPDMARQFVSMRRAGVGSIVTSQGRQALTQETALAVLEENAKRIGADWQTLKPTLMRLTAALEGGKSVTVQTSGLDRPSVQRSRGGAS